MGWEDRAWLSRVRDEVVEGLLWLGETTSWMCEIPSETRQRFFLGFSPLSPSCTFGDMGYTGTVTLRGVWGYGPEVDRTLGQVNGAEGGGRGRGWGWDTSDCGQSEQMVPGGHCLWKRGPDPPTP